MSVFKLFIDNKHKKHIDNSDTLPQKTEAMSNFLPPNNNPYFQQWGVENKPAGVFTVSLGWHSESKTERDGTHGTPF